MTSGKKSESL